MKFLSKLKIYWIYIILLSLTSVVGLAKLKAKNDFQMGNPASNYCLKKEGYLERYSGQKGEIGICWIGQGGIEEWTFYQYSHGSREKLKAIELLLKNSRENGPVHQESARKQCEDLGGKIEILASQERPDLNLTLCRFSDQSALESWTLYYGASHFAPLKKLLIEE